MLYVQGTMLYHMEFALLQNRTDVLIFLGEISQNRTHCTALHHLLECVLEVFGGTICPRSTEETLFNLALLPTGASRTYHMIV